jgi:hypothetical protein
MRKTALVSVLVVAVLALIGLAAAGYDTDFQKAVDYYKTRHYEEAVRALEDYVEERPYGHAYYLLGYANYALGRHAEAAKNFKDAYLVDPEFSPGQFRRDIGIDRPISAKPKKKAAPAAPEAPAEAEKPAPVEAAPAAPEAPAVAAKPAPEAAPAAPKAPVAKPRPRPIPAPTMPTVAPMAFLAALGLIPLVIGLVFYLYFSLCLFLIAKKTDTAAPWTAFIPILQVWPVVGAAGKPVWWIVLLIVPIVNIIVLIYLWMLIAERLGKNKFLGLLMLVPVVNIVFLGLLAFKGRAAAAAAAGAGFELPDIPEELPELPDVPGFEEAEEEPPFEEAPAAEAPEEDDFGGFLDETAEAPPEEADFGDLFDETAEAPAEEDLFEETTDEAPSLEDMGFVEEAEEEDEVEIPSFEEEAEEEGPPKEEPPPEEFFKEAFPVEAPAEEAFEAAAFEAPAEEAFEAAAFEAPAEEAFEAAAFEDAAPEGAFEEAPAGEPFEYEAAEEEFDAFPAVPAGAGIIGVGDLFKNTFEIYKKRLILLLILLAAYVFAGVAFGIFFGIGMLLGIAVESLRAGFITGGTVVGAIAAVITGFWGSALRTPTGGRGRGWAHLSGSRCS